MIQIIFLTELLYGKLNKPRIAQIHTNKYSPKLVNKIRVIRAICGQHKKHLRILGFKEGWEVKLILLALASR